MSGGSYDASGFQKFTGPKSTQFVGREINSDLGKSAMNRIYSAEIGGLVLKIGLVGLGIFGGVGITSLFGLEGSDFKGTAAALGIAGAVIGYGVGSAVAPPVTHRIALYFAESILDDADKEKVKQRAEDIYQSGFINHLRSREILGDLEDLEEPTKGVALGESEQSTDDF